MKCSLVIVSVLAANQVMAIQATAQSRLTCPAGFQVVHDPLGALCLTVRGTVPCPASSQPFTMDGKPLCLHIERPYEASPPGQSEALPRPR
jgi:hypothetical protein